MNIAEIYKSRYESDYFINDYSYCLFEQFGYDKDIIIDRIRQYCQNYEFQQMYGYNKYFDLNILEQIYEYIEDNFEDFQLTFNSYYVGYTSLCSVEFGEQEEQLTGIYNHKTGKEYNIKYLRKIFESEDYCINRSYPDYAYYIVSGGLHIDLLAKEIPFLINLNLK